MTAAYFEDHPTDSDKVILRKPKHDFGEPWSPVSIGVDITAEGAHVVGIYALDKDTSQIFYAKYYPVPQRTWVGLTDEEIEMLYAVTIKIRKKDIMPGEQKMFARTIQELLKEKNT